MLLFKKKQKNPSPCTRYVCILSLTFLLCNKPKPKSEPQIVKVQKACPSENLEKFCNIAQRGLNRWSNNSEQKFGFLSKVKILKNTFNKK